MPANKVRPRTNNTLPKLHRRYCKTAQCGLVRLDVSEYTQQELAEEVTRIMLKKLGIVVRLRSVVEVQT